MWQEGKIKEISDICSVITEFFLYLLWPVIFTIILASKHLIIFLFSANFTEASTALIILFIGNIFFSLASFYMGTLNAGHNAKSVAISIILGNTINIILNIALVPIFGITGAATATALSYFSILVFLAFKMHKSFDGFFINMGNYKKFLLSTLVGIICVIIAVPFRNCHFEVAVFTLIISNLLYFIITYAKLIKHVKFFVSLIKT